MPKRSKRRKGRGRRSKPTGLNSLRETTEMDDGPIINQSGGVPVLTKLRSTNPNERELGCQIVASIVFEDKEAVGKLIGAGVVDLLVQRLCDKSLEVRAAATGASQNFCFAGGEVAVRAFLSLDCLTPLFGNLKLLETDTCTEEETTLRLHTIALTVELLSLLCECTEEATMAVSESGVAISMLSFLQIEGVSYPSNLMINTAKFLLTVIQDNATLEDQFKRQERLPSIFQTITTNTEVSPLLRAYTAGIIGGMYGLTDTQQLLDYVIPLVQVLLAFDPINTVQTMMEDIPSIKTNISTWKEHVAAQQVALELLANVCVHLVEGAERDASIGVSVRELLLKGTFADLFSKVIKCCEASGSAIKALWSASTPAQVKALPVCLSQTPLLAFGCVANMVLAFEPSAICSVSDLWEFLSTMCVGAQAASNEDLVDVVARSMWTLLRKQEGSLNPSKQQVEESILTLCAPGVPPQIRVSGIGMLAMVGPRLEDSALVASIAQALMHPLTEDPADPTLVVEAINGVIDVFADAHADVFLGLDMLPHLTAVAPCLNNLEKEANAVDEELFERLQETNLNLIRFIEYKNTSE